MAPTTRPTRLASTPSTTRSAALSSPATRTAPTPARRRPSSTSPTSAARFRPTPTPTGSATPAPDPLSRLPGARRAGPKPSRLAGGGHSFRRPRGGARRPHRLLGHPRRGGDGTGRRRRRLLLRRLAATLDRRSVGGTRAARLPGPRDSRRPHAGGIAVRNPRWRAPSRLLALRLGNPRDVPSLRGPYGCSSDGTSLERGGLELGWGDSGAALESDPALDQRSPRAAFRIRPRRRSRRLLAARDARARLLDPADDPLRAAPRRGGDLPPIDPARGRHRSRARHRDGAVLLAQ